jgi:hypothetical protein
MVGCLQQTTGEKMAQLVDDFLSRLIAALHSDWPDLHSTVARGVTLQAFEMIGLVERTVDESGRTKWEASPELELLVAESPIAGLLEDPAPDLEDQHTEFEEDNY